MFIIIQYNNTPTKGVCMLSAECFDTQLLIKVHNGGLLSPVSPSFFYVVLLAVSVCSIISCCSCVSSKLSFTLRYGRLGSYSSTTHVFLSKLLCICHAYPWAYVLSCLTFLALAHHTNSMACIPPLFHSSVVLECFVFILACILCWYYAICSLRPLCVPLCLCVETERT